MPDIRELLNVPPGQRKAVLCFGFGHSRGVYPADRSDPSPGEAFVEVMKRRFARDHFSIVVGPVLTAKYLRTVMDVGAFIDHRSVPIEARGRWGGLERPGIPTHAIVAEVEKCVERYARHDGLDRWQWRRATMETVGFWAEVMSAFDEVFYLCGNVPHVFDDLIAYRVAQALGHPTLCLYRLPILPRLSVRTMIFEDIFRQDRPLPLPNGATPPALGPDDLAEVMRRLAGAPPSPAPSAAQPGGSGVSVAAAKPAPARRATGQKLLRGLKAVQRRIRNRTLRAEMFEAGRVWREYRGHVTHTLPDRFVYYPLHMQPEASSHPLGGIYGDQEMLVHHLVEALPEGVKLVVKDHPLQLSSIDRLATRGRGFYARMAADPRIVLLHHSVPPRTLLPRCLAAVTLTGTTALEALAMGKPCFVMGASPFVRAPNALVPRDHAALCGMMQALAEGRVPPVRAAETTAYLDWLRAHSVFGYVDPYTHPQLEGLFSQDDNIAAVTTALCAAIDQIRARQTAPVDA